MFNLNLKIDKKEIFSSFITNFIKGGLLIGLSVIIIEFIYKSNNLIGFFAYVSASFFLIQLFQYYYLNYKGSKGLDKFLLHSLIGGIVWVIFMIIMIVIHKYTNNINLVVISCILLYIFGLIIYYFLLKNTNFIKYSI